MYKCIKYVTIYKYYIYFIYLSNPCILCIFCLKSSILGFNTQFTWWVVKNVSSMSYCIFICWVLFACWGLYGSWLRWSLLLMFWHNNVFLPLRAYVVLQSMIIENIFKKSIYEVKGHFQLILLLFQCLIYWPFLF